jgi:hypothetical protein
MHRDTLLAAGFVEDAIEGRAFQCDAQGRVIAFGFHRRDEHGAIRARWVEIDPDRGLALTTISKAHPFPRPDYALGLEAHLAFELRDMVNAETDQPHCDFCGKSNTEVARLFAGPSVMICNECVRMCQEILG